MPSIKKAMCPLRNLAENVACKSYAGKKHMFHSQDSFGTGKSLMAHHLLHPSSYIPLTVECFHCLFWLTHLIII